MPEGNRAQASNGPPGQRIVEAVAFDRGLPGRFLGFGR